MKTKINITHVEKLNAAIKEAEGRATARTISADVITRIIEKASRNIPKKKLSGTIVYYDGAEHFPYAYKYIPMSTHFEAENFNGRWYVTYIYRDVCPNRKTSSVKVSYSDTAKEYIIKEASNF